MRTRIICNMKEYKCKTCGTGYSTTGKDTPPSPVWADGHTCEMIEAEHKFNDNEQ